MPLTPISKLIRHAISHQYAIGYFESWNLESLQGVIDAAEQSRSPVIIGFNGEFLSLPDRKAAERLSWYGALGKAAADSASVPCGFIFNECSRADWVHDAVTAGFNLVMPIPAAGESASAYTTQVGELVRYAHQHDVAVEAELGTLPYGGQGGEFTNPQLAADFVRATGIDLLAISVGNVHVLLHGHRDLDLERLHTIRKQVDIPFVLHGGTGISAESLKAAIQTGVAKVNYGTVIKQRYLQAIRNGLNTTEANPHHLLGMGGSEDLLVMGRVAVRDAILEKMALLGCIGKADDND